MVSSLRKPIYLLSLIPTGYMFCRNSRSVPSFIYFSEEIYDIMNVNAFIIRTHVHLRFLLKQQPEQPSLQLSVVEPALVLSRSKLTLSNVENYPSAALMHFDWLHSSSRFKFVNKNFLSCCNFFDPKQWQTSGTTEVINILTVI